MFTHTGILPPLVVLPLAILAVLVISAHLAAMQADGDAPLSRKRIRTANGVVMLVTTVVLGYAFAYTSTADPRAFALSWAAAVLLLTAVLFLSTIDVLNNVRLSGIQRRRVQRAATALNRELTDLLRHARDNPIAAPEPPFSLHHPANDDPRTQPDRNTPRADGEQADR